MVYWLVSCLLLVSSVAWAKQPIRWFEIEIILFAQEQDLSTIEEDFTTITTTSPSAAEIDFLTPYHFPDLAPAIHSLPSCTAQQPLWQQHQLALNILPIFCRTPEEGQLFTIPFVHQVNYQQAIHYAELPRQVTQPEPELTVRPHLLAKSSLQLSQQFQQLQNHRTIRPILHLGWRQPGLSEQRAQSVRLFAGRQLSPELLAFDQQLHEQHDTIDLTEVTDTAVDLETSSNDIQANIQRLLTTLSSQSTQTKHSEQASIQIDRSPWEVDGAIKIFMRGRYLYISGELVYQTPIEEQKIQRIAFQQSRRVITQQVHYFDHPAIGMIVQSRRYLW